MNYEEFCTALNKIAPGCHVEESPTKELWVMTGMVMDDDGTVRYATDAELGIEAAAHE